MNEDFHTWACNRKESAKFPDTFTIRLVRTILLYFRRLWIVVTELPICLVAAYVGRIVTVITFGYQLGRQRPIVNFNITEVE